MTIQLTRAERSTAEEERKDPGALLRLRAIGGHVSHKIERIMGSLEHKLDQASGEHSHAATGPAKPRVVPSDDAWVRLRELERSVARSGMRISSVRQLFVSVPVCMWLPVCV